MDSKQCKACGNGMLVALLMWSESATYYECNKCGHINRWRYNLDEYRAEDARKTAR